MQTMRTVLVGLVLGLVLGAATPPRAAAVYLVTLDAPIHPITSEYVVNAIRRANEEGASLILIEMDTPGGYVTSVEKIQKAILASRAPVATYVAPSGARAASGGAFIAITCDLLAMAPGTNIGAAHPVSGMPLPVPSPSPGVPAPGGEKNPSPSKAPQQGAVEMKKIVNDLSAHMRTIAQNRGRNAEMAEKMVRESISLTEKEALEAGLIDLVADSKQDIFQYLRDHPIQRFNGTSETLDLAGSLSEVPVEMTLREEFLSALANPGLAYILLILGALGLFVEFKSPGLIFPGVLGGIFILLYLMSIPLLPVNVVGLLLILLGIAFFVLEVKVVSYGMLTIGGIIALVMGSVMLYSGGPIPELRLSLYIVLPVALAFSGIVIFLLVLAAKSMRNPVATGKEGLIGLEGVVRSAIEPPAGGKVFVFGELWNAVSDGPIAEGEHVKVTGEEGMALRVVPLRKPH